MFRSRSRLLCATRARVAQHGSNGRIWKAARNHGIKTPERRHENLGLLHTMVRLFVSYDEYVDPMCSSNCAIEWTY